MALRDIDVAKEATSQEILSKLGSGEALNEMFYRNDEYLIQTSTPSKTLVSSGTEIGGNTRTQMATFELGENCDLIVINMKARTNGSGAPVIVEIVNSSGTTVSTLKYVTGVSLVTFDLSGPALKADTYKLFISSNSGIYWFYTNVSVSTTTFSHNISAEKYMLNTVKDSLVNSSSGAVALSNMPRLDRCEFDYFVSGTGYSPLLSKNNGVNYVRAVPPYCVMRIKY